MSFNHTHSSALCRVYSSETWRACAFLNKAAATQLRVAEAEQIKAREHVGSWGY